MSNALAIDPKHIASGTYSGSVSRRYQRALLHDPEFKRMDTVFELRDLLKDCQGNLTCLRTGSLAMKCTQSESIAR